MGNDDVARPYTQSKKIQCLKQQMLLAQLQKAGIQLSKDQLVILADTGERIDFGPGAFTVTSNALFQADGLEAPTEGYEDAIVVPAITANNFKFKHGLLTLVQNKQFFGHDKEDPHAHGAAWIWLEKEPPQSIFTCDDLVSKFINQLFPPSKTTNLRNEITNFQQRFDESFSEAWDRFKDILRACPHHGFFELHQLDTFYNALNSNDQDSLNSVAGGNFLDKMPCECLAIIESKSKVRYSRNKPVVSKVSTNTSTSGISPDVAELKEMVKALLLDKKSQSPAPVKEVEESCVTCGGAHSYHNCPATDGNVYHDNIQEFVSQASAVNYNQGNTSYRPPIMSNQIRPPGFPPIPNNQNVQRNNQNHFIPNQNQGNNFNQGPVYQPPVFQPPAYQARAYQAPAPQTQALIGNKEKLSEMAQTLLNEHCSAVLLKKLPEKLGDPGKFLIPCDFPGMAECLALADLGASINLMPFSVWKRLFLPDLKPTSFLKTGRALIDVFEGELTLCVGKEAITFNLDQTSRYSANYSDMMAKRIDVIDMACVEDSDFLLEEVDAFLTIEDDPTSPEFYQPSLDHEGDILLLEAFLNDDPSLPPQNQVNYLPEELKICEAKSDKSSVDEPPAVELKDLPAHLEYAFLEGDNKLPFIIAKYLSVEEKTALIAVLKSHKRAIAWKLSDIKAGLIYSISDSLWVSPMHCVPKKGEFTVVENKDNELIPTHLVTGWRVCIDYRKLNEVTRKDHFPLLFMDQMLERLAGNQYYCFLDGFFGYFQIPIDPKDQEKTTFTCPYRTFAYRRMPFGLCNALGTFQMCMMEIFHDMIEKTIEVFMDDFFVFGIFFQSCLSHLERMLKRKLTEAPILIAPDWDMPFELMSDASDYAIGAVLGQRQDKHFRPIHYSILSNHEQEHYVHGPFRPQISVCQKRFKGEIAPMGSSSLGIHIQSD
uniref:Reverse transcriptase domain-containing protein n=1 Tax=Tanacetum cinerariifolium TaxID=118510 RepID=A0A6L2MBU1_TANCI|nr:reverse transcriptase domain-containing protein [Tanacetum cinerariifolium]